jgi:hypothetical protein
MSKTLYYPDSPEKRATLPEENLKEPFRRKKANEKKTDQKQKRNLFMIIIIMFDPPHKAPNPENNSEGHRPKSINPVSPYPEDTGCLWCR